MREKERDRIFISGSNSHINIRIGLAHKYIK